MFAAFLVLALAFAASRLLNKRIFETLPVAVFVMTLAVYVFALLLSLRTSVFVCTGLAIVVLIVSLIRRGGQRESSKIPYVALVITCVAFCILVSGHSVFYYDDLSYWGLYTKNLFSINKLPHLFENCSVDYKDYTPIMQVLQYIAMFGRKSFDEGMMFQTNVCFIYIILIPILSVVFEKCEETNDISGSRKGISLLKVTAVIMYVIFPHILTAQFYYRLGVDLFLALTFGYVLYNVFIYESKDAQSEWFRMIAITSALSFLALIKTSGIVLCLLALIMLIVNSKPSKGKLLPGIIRISLPLIFTFGSYFSWQLFLHYSWNNGYLSNRVKDSVTGGSFALPPYTGEVILNYIKHFFTYPLTRNAIGVTAFVLVVFIVLVHIFTRASKGEDCSVTKRMLVCSMTGLIIFCIAHICMYLFVFDEWEAHGLMEYDRYITQYLGGVFFLYVCRLLKCSGVVRESDIFYSGSKSENSGPSPVSNNTLKLLVVSTIVFTVLLPYKDMMTYLVPANYRAAFDDGYALMAQNAEDEWNSSGIAELDLPHDGTQKLTVVANAWDETTQFLEYVAVPQPFNRVVNVPAADPGSINGFIMDFVDEYVYVSRNAPDSYTGDWDETSELTSDSTPLKAGTLYLVDRSGEKKKLVEM